MHSENARVSTINEFDRNRSYPMIRMNDVPYTAPMTAEYITGVSRKVAHSGFVRSRLISGSMSDSIIEIPLPVIAPSTASLAVPVWSLSDRRAKPTKNEKQTPSKPLMIKSDT